jgi:hypothetical protein
VLFDGLVFPPRFADRKDAMVAEPEPASFQ